jgi:hypothetical protein
MMPPAAGGQEISSSRFKVPPASGHWWQPDPACDSQIADRW